MNGKELLLVMKQRTAVGGRLKRGFWSAEEDVALKKCVETHGEGNWATISAQSGLMRSGKSCRLRWKNYLRPDIKRGMMSADEKDLIIRMHKLLGNRWSLIAGRLPGRTDNEVKNFWNTHLNKRRRRRILKKTTLPPPHQLGVLDDDNHIHNMISSPPNNNNNNDKGGIIIVDDKGEEEEELMIKEEEEDSWMQMGNTSYSSMTAATGNNFLPSPLMMFGGDDPFCHIPVWDNDGGGILFDETFLHTILQGS
ncbi:unnamed protein product [Cuscuta epithymum]|uniref:Uncharacterized protein n=2 Tax=Cuscuta epithymum TaxID=186058 RepID=A0AAV0F6Z5_9ASTE|nr:unnamed protein product [Cuscuta epithymum]